MKKTSTVIIAIIILVIGAIYLFRDRLISLFFSPTTSPIRQGVTTKDIDEKSTSNEQVENIEIVAENLEIPWEMAFLPDGSMLVTERPGRLLKISTKTKIITEIEGVEHVGEGGLMGMALHPDFQQNRWIYLYFTTRTNEGLTNRVERYIFENDSLSDKKTIIQGIKGAANHDGGRMEFGPDGYLYLTTGDAQVPNSAQDSSSLNGKVLRITDEGETPSNNPFGNEVYSMGHRNPQGITWDDRGQLWISEHGPSGFQSGFDEINLIRMGANYGWPVVRGEEEREGLISPVIQSGSDDTWAPAGIEFLNGSLFFAGLRGETLYEAKISENNTLELTRHFSGEFGRLRAVRIGPDGFLYITTSNRDGRGSAGSGDDKIIKINPGVFE
ncbi:MAG: PQQ-dependent sugar dehydrogenase [Candidatus Woesebacteria bacterium]|jgi:glucose/arabinose dehydrogenase